MPICTAVEVFYLEKSDWLGLYKQLDISDSSGVVFGCGWCRCVARVCVFGCLCACVVVCKTFTSSFHSMGPKFRFLKKVFPTIFFTHKTCFTTFHIDWSQKIDKSFFEPIFQNFLQVIVPLSDQNFNIWKKCFRQIFSLTKHVSQHFTLIEAKKSTKIFSTPFFKTFYKCLSTLIWGTKKIFSKIAFWRKK